MRYFIGQLFYDQCSVTTILCIRTHWTDFCEQIGMPRERTKAEDRNFYYKGSEVQQYYESVNLINYTRSCGKYKKTNLFIRINSTQDVLLKKIIN